MLAGLTAQQALEIGAALLAEAATRPEPDTEGLGGEQVMIGTDGRVVLVPASQGGHIVKSPSGTDPTASAVAAVLADLASAARRCTRRPAPPTTQLIAELDRAVTQLPVAGVRVVARTLGEACAAIDRRAVRAELAVLVRAVIGSSGAVGGSRSGGLAGVVGPERGRPARRQPSGGNRGAVRRIWAWLGSLAVLVAVVLLEVAFLRDDIVADVDLLLDAGRSGSASSSAPRPDSLPVVPPAPAAAGIVTAVDLRTLEPCAPGSPCSVRVLVRLVPGLDPRTVTWSFRVVDLCTGVTDSAPGGSFTVPPGIEQAAAIGTVGLPPLAAVAVVAVTEQPAAAAAPPVLVGSCDPDRPAG